MEQVTVLGAKYGVADGEAQDSEGAGETKRVRVVIFNDPHTGKAYQFPLLLENAKELGAQLSADDLSELRDEHKGGPDLVVPGREPTPQELANLQRASRGEPPEVPGIPVQKRGRPIGS